MRHMCGGGFFPCYHTIFPVAFCATLYLMFLPSVVNKPSCSLWQILPVFSRFENQHSSASGRDRFWVVWSVILELKPIGFPWWEANCYFWSSPSLLLFFPLDTNVFLGYKIQECTTRAPCNAKALEYLAICLLPRHMLNGLGCIRATVVISIIKAYRPLLSRECDIIYRTPTCLGICKFCPASSSDRQNT